MDRGEFEFQTKSNIILQIKTTTAEYSTKVGRRNYGLANHRFTRRLPIHL